MTLPTFSEIDKDYISALGEKIKEFEYRKIVTFAFFERNCAKKPFQERRDVFFCLKDADYDFSEGNFFGTSAARAQKAMAEKGFSREWTKNLMYAYWFSLPKEREALKNHIIAGVVATRPELKRSRPTTEFYNMATSILGKELFTHQCNLVWPNMRENALMRLAQEQNVAADQIVDAIQTAQVEVGKKNLNAGIRSLTAGLMPSFFKQEQSEASENKAEGIPYETIQSISQKKEVIEPYLNNFSWLYLTQAPFHQKLEMRQFWENLPTKQMLLPFNFARERDE